MKKTKSVPKTRQRRKPNFPRGWDQKRVQAVIDQYDRQTEDEELAEYEAAMAINGRSTMLVPTELIPEIRKLIADRTRPRPRADRPAPD
jgi:hypothetical protein